MHSLSCSALVMEGSEPSLVPEWLRGGNYFASSQTDGTSSSLTRRNKASKIVSNSNGPSSSFVDQSTSTNSRREVCSNGSNKHEKNSYSRSYNNHCTRNQPKKDRERFGDCGLWNSEDSDPLKGMRDTMRGSHSMIPRRRSELSQRRVFTDLRSRSHSINANDTNGTISVHRAATGIQKVSLEGDLPLLGSDERSMTPNIVRVPLPGLSTGFQDLPIGTSSLASCESRPSVLVKVPMGGNGTSSSSIPSASANATGPVYAPCAAASNGINMVEALVKLPTSNNAPQQSVETQRSKELPFMVAKRLIPVTASMPRNSVHYLADKLKPKTASRPIDVGIGSKNGLRQTSFMQLGTQSGKSVSARGDAPQSPKTRKMVLLKSSRENGVSPVVKDNTSQTINGTGVIANSQSVASIPLKNPNNAKLSTNERRTCAYGLNVVPLIDKRLSLAQLQSRNDFFNLMRKKSLGAASVGGSFDIVLTSSGKELASDPVALNENDSIVKCDGNACNLAEKFSDCRESEEAGVYSNEEEKAFLRSLGWEENAGDDEGLTEEEINGFYRRYMQLLPSSKLYQGLRIKLSTHPDCRSSCTVAASSS